MNFFRSRTRLHSWAVARVSEIGSETKLEHGSGKYCYASGSQSFLIAVARDYRQLLKVVAARLARVMLFAVDRKPPRSFGEQLTRDKSKQLLRLRLFELLAKILDISMGRCKVSSASAHSEKREKHHDGSDQNQAVAVGTRKSRKHFEDWNQYCRNGYWDRF